MVIVQNHVTVVVHRGIVSSDRRHRDPNKVHPHSGSSKLLTMVFCHPDRRGYARLRRHRAPKFLWFPRDDRIQRGRFNYLSHARVVSFLSGHCHWSSSCCTSVGRIPLLPFRSLRLSVTGFVAAEADKGSTVTATIIGTNLLPINKLSTTLGLRFPVTTVGSSERIRIQSC